MREKSHFWLLSLQFLWRSTCSSEKEEEGERKRRKRRRRKLGFEVWLRFGISFFYFVFVGVVILFWILNGEVWCEKCVKKHVGILRDLSKFSKTLFFLFFVFCFCHILA